MSTLTTISTHTLPIHIVRNELDELRFGTATEAAGDQALGTACLGIQIRASELQSDLLHRLWISIAADEPNRVAAPTRKRILTTNILSTGEFGFADLTSGRAVGTAFLGGVTSEQEGELLHGRRLHEVINIKRNGAVQSGQLALVPVESSTVTSRANSLDIILRTGGGLCKDVKMRKA